MIRRVVLGVLAGAVIGACVLGSCGCENKPAGYLVTEDYTVVSGDNLDQIAATYMAKSSVRRDIREFREGIIQENWETVFSGRYPYGLLMPGDKLKINYWKEDAK
jgi:hypothetical protein